MGKETRLSDIGFARRVDAELDALGYPENHDLRRKAVEICTRVRPDLPEGVVELVERFRAMARAHYETRHDRSRLLEDQSKLRSDFYAKTADALEALAGDNAEYRRIIFGGADSLPETSTDLQKRIAKHHQDREAEIAAKDAEIARLREGLGLIETEISSEETYNPNIAKIVRIALQEDDQ